MKINFDKLIPEAIARQTEESKEVLEALMFLQVPMRLGFRKDTDIFYRIKFTITNWGKYGKKA